MDYVVPSSHTQRLEEILRSRCEAAIFDNLVLVIALYLLSFLGYCICRLHYGFPDVLQLGYNW